MQHIYEYLKDVVDHTLSLGNIDLVRVNGTDVDTQVDAMAEDRSVLFLAKTHKPIPEFIGQFGMPNLTKLNVILNIPEYKENSKISVTTQEKTQEEKKVTVPTGLHFENKSGDFKNDYRFMSSELINAQLKTVKAKKDIKWNVEFSPQVQNIQRLKFMAAANSEETTFIAKTENGALKFYFGDHSSHAGNFVFADGITGTLTKAYHWPIAVVQSILSLQGDKIFRFSDEGAAQITVDSGLGLYTYTLPAMQK
jgi:hypothetical protein